MTQKQTPTLVSARNIWLAKGAGWILEDVSLDISADDFITLVGPNGAGKSMLLRTLLQLQKPSRGTVHHTHGLRIGYVPEKIAIDAAMPLNVQGFLRLNSKMSDPQFEALVGETGIEPLLNTPLAALSSGELQRVLLARALAGDPHLLILDEPAQNLDVNGQLHLYRLIEKLYGTRKLAVLMVSHDLHLVMSSTRKVVCLYHHICCSGAPENVARDPEFISLFGDDMANLMAVYPHSHEHDHDHDHAHSGIATADKENPA